MYKKLLVKLFKQKDMAQIIKESKKKTFMVLNQEENPLKDIFNDDSLSLSTQNSATQNTLHPVFDNEDFKKIVQRMQQYPNSCDKTAN